MQHHVVEALGRLLGEIGIQTDIAGEGVAASPTGFHALYEGLSAGDSLVLFPSAACHS